MARIIRLQGPAAALELIASWQTIPGFSVRRYFQGPFLLFIGRIKLGNTGAAVNIQYRITIDGVSPAYQPQVSTLLAGFQGSFPILLLQQIDQGEHTLELQAYGNAPAGDTVAVQATSLAIIELPDWDNFPLITNL